MDKFAGENKIHLLIESVRQGQNFVRCNGIGITERAYLISRLSREIHNTQVLVLQDFKACEEFSENLHFFADNDTPEIILFPSYNILPFKRASYHNVTAANRIHTLYNLAVNNSPKIVVTPVETLLQRLIPKQVLCDYAELLMCGEEIDRDILIAKLHSGGYTHVTLVEDFGEYSVRGGIIDIYSPLYPEPLRIELFGDTVESIRFFSSATQRKIESVNEAVILPARETVLEKSRMNQTVRRIRDQVDENGLSSQIAEEFIERIRKEGVFPGIESLLPLVYQQLDTLFDYVPENSLWIESNSGALDKAALYAEGQAAKNYLDALQDERLSVDPETLYLKWTSVKERIKEEKRLLFCELPLMTPNHESGQPVFRIDFSVQNNTEISSALLEEKKDRHILAPFSEWINEKQSAGFLILIVCSSESQIKRLQSLVAPYEIYPRLTEAPVEKIKYRKTGIYVCLGNLSTGFVWYDESLAIITENEIFGSKQRRRRSKKKTRGIKTALLDFGELNAGDLVVHIEHGIGIYRGLEKLSFEGIVNDYLLLVYKDDDKLYLPVDRLDMAQKYMGVDGIKPVVDKMGGKSWQRIRAKAKKSVEKIAGELLALYSSRKVSKDMHLHRRIITTRILKQVSRTKKHLINSKPLMMCFATWKTHLPWIG